MNVSLKKWDISDAKDLAEVLSNKKIHDNLRDGLPYPYTEHDGREFITSVLASDENEMFSFAIMAAQKVIGSITAVKNTGAEVLWLRQCGNSVNMSLRRAILSGSLPSRLLITLHRAVSLRKQDFIMREH